MRRLATRREARGRFETNTRRTPPHRDRKRAGQGTAPHQAGPKEEFGEKSGRGTEGQTSFVSNEVRRILAAPNSKGRAGRPGERSPERTVPSATANGGPERDSNPRVSGFKPEVLRCTTKERTAYCSGKGFQGERRGEHPPPERRRRTRTCSPERACRRNSSAHCLGKERPGRTAGDGDGPKALAGFEPATICPRA